MHSHHVRDVDTHISVILDTAKDVIDTALITDRKENISSVNFLCLGELGGERTWSHLAIIIVYGCHVRDDLRTVQAGPHKTVVRELVDLRSS